MKNKDLVKTLKQVDKDWCKDEPDYTAELCMQAAELIEKLSGPIYFMYSRSSEDGRVPPDFKGTTRSRKKALAFHKKVKANPYDSGMVKILDGDTFEWWRPE